MRQPKRDQRQAEEHEDQKDQPADDQPDEHAIITVLEAAIAAALTNLAVGSGGCPRHAVDVVGFEVERVRDEALDVGAENGEVDALAVVDHGRILLGEDVLGFLHQLVELLLAFEVLRLGHDLLEARVDPGASV